MLVSASEWASVSVSVSVSASVSVLVPAWESVLALELCTILRSVPNC